LECNKIWPDEHLTVAGYLEGVLVADVVVGQPEREEGEESRKKYPTSYHILYNALSKVCAIINTSVGE
jgi:hypothetical protein